MTIKSGLCLKYRATPIATQIANTQIETCVSEVLSGKRDWYVKAWENTYEAFYGALDWFKGLFGSSSSLSLSYLMISLFAVAMN